MAESEILQIAFEPKINGDDNTCPTIDSDTIQDNKVEQSETNTSGDIDMLDAEVKEKVHSADDHEVPTNGDSTKKQDNIDEVPIVKEKITATPNERNGDLIEEMDVDLDINVSDSSIVVKEEEEDALLEDEVKCKDATSKATVSIIEESKHSDVTAKEPDQSEVTAEEPKQSDLMVKELDKSDVNAEEPTQSADVTEEELNQSDVNAVERKQSDLTAEVPKQSDLMVKEPNKSDVNAEEPTQSADVTEEELNQSDVNAVERKQSDLTAEVPKQSDLMVKEPNKSDVNAEEPIQTADVTEEELNPSNVNAVERKQSDLTAEEPKLSAVVNLNVDCPDVVSSKSVSNGVEIITSSSSVVQKSDSDEEEIITSSANDKLFNMSDVISLDEESMSETDKPDHTSVKLDSNKCINIDDDDDIMLVDDELEKMDDKVNRDEQLTNHEDVKNNHEMKPHKGFINDVKEEIVNVDKIDEDVKIHKGPNIDESDKEVKNENVSIDDKAKHVDVFGIDEKVIDAKVTINNISNLGEDNKIDDISEVDAVVKVGENEKIQIGNKIQNLGTCEIVETDKKDALIEPFETTKNEVIEISQVAKVEDQLKIANAEEETKCKDGEKSDLLGSINATFVTSGDDNSKDTELRKISSINDQSCETNVTPSEHDVPLSETEGLDEKTILFIDDVVKSGFKKILLSEDSVEKKPLLPSNFIKSFSKKLSDMTRDDLEEFCLLKIVEGIVERSTLSEATTKLKSLMQYVDEWRKKAQQLQKQNRDLTVVLRNIQEEHRKRAHGVVTPLKITRSVGLQVANVTSSNNQNNQNIPNIPMAEPKPPKQKKKQGKSNLNRNQKQSKTSIKSIQMITPIKAANANVPVPRLVPVIGSPTKLGQIKNSSATNGVNTTPAKGAEKRPLSELNNSIDLTDDEPPSKQMAVTSPKNVMRLVNPGQAGAGPRMAIMVNSPINFSSTSPRQVYIPISGQGAQGTIRTGQTLMFAGTGPRPKASNQINPPPLVRSKGELQDPSLPPLPGSYRQVHLPNWKWIPPTPELKISRVDSESTSIVISWMLKDFDETKHEKVVSYQIYAYHESNARVTSSASWIKIGDVKALPLPMACTLSQFKMQNKYHFVVRGVDAKSRVGPFSPPGSIVLVKHPINGINK